MLVGVFGRPEQIKIPEESGKIIKEGRLSFLELDPDFGWTEGYGVVLEANERPERSLPMISDVKLDPAVGIQLLDAGRVIISLRLPRWGMGGLMIDYETEPLGGFSQQDWARVTFALPERYRLESSSTPPVGLSLPPRVEADQNEEPPWLMTSRIKLIYEVTRGTTDVQFVIVDDLVVRQALLKSMLGPTILGAGIGFLFAGLMGLGTANPTLGAQHEKVERPSVEASECAAVPSTKRSVEGHSEGPPPA